METIKLGSKGEAVKTLQKKLNVYPDGVFGQTTKTVLIQYQRTHGLTPDGVCGDKTWASFGMYVATGVDSCVIYSPLSKNITKSANRQIKYLVIHYSGSSNSRVGRAADMKSTFVNGGASADFGVDDGQIVQFNPDPKNYYCWAVGGNNWRNKGGLLYGLATNRNTIHIEICSTCMPNTSKAVLINNHKGWSFSEAALNNARKLARILMKKYGITKDRVVRHYDVTGKPCPSCYGWNDEPIRDLNDKVTSESNNSKAWETWKASL